MMLYDYCRVKLVCLKISLRTIINFILFVQGIEDAVGNMDFKIAGTREGITSLQVS